MDWYWHDWYLKHHQNGINLRFPTLPSLLEVSQELDSLLSPDISERYLKCRYPEAWYKLYGYGLLVRENQTPKKAGYKVQESRTILGYLKLLVNSFNQCLVGGLKVGVYTNLGWFFEMINILWNPFPVTGDNRDQMIWCVKIPINLDFTLLKFEQQKLLKNDAWFRRSLSLPFGALNHIFRGELLKMSGEIADTCTWFEISTASVTVFRLFSENTDKCGKPWGDRRHHERGGETPCAGFSPAFSEDLGPVVQVRFRPCDISWD